MTPIMLYRTRSGSLMPADDEARAALRRFRLGQRVLCTARLPRNPGLHRKFFAMLAFAYDHWDPPASAWGGQVAVKDRETFRKELTIAAGYYTIILGLDGKAHLEARSLAWDRMGDEEFEPLYEAVVKVLARGFLPGVTAEVMEEWARQYSEAA